MDSPGLLADEALGARHLSRAAPQARRHLPQRVCLPMLGILGRRILRVMSPISAPAGPAALAFENFLAVLTIIFLQQHLRLQLPRNRTERFGALRAADAITIRKFHER